MFDIAIGDWGVDLLISGFTLLYISEAALSLLLAEWSSSRFYSQRVANLRQGTGPNLNGSGVTLMVSGENRTVIADGVVNVLRGKIGRDWFFANTQTDFVLDRDPFEFLDPISISN